jgi:Protein of unknown function (DUF2862)
LVFDPWSIAGVEMDIGQKVRVRRLRDRPPKEVIARLGKTGVIDSYKMVDGSGVGAVVSWSRWPENLNHRQRMAA